MAEISSSTGNTSQNDEDLVVGDAKIEQFEIRGLFGRPLNYIIPFPAPPPNASDPELLILSGTNGCGKTTILRMIDGMLRLDFDTFRQMPFESAKLTLSTGEELSVKSRNNKEIPLFVRFNDLSAELRQEKENYTPEQSQAISDFRKMARPILGNIRFQLLDIHRSSALRQAVTEQSPIGGLLPRHIDPYAYHNVIQARPDRGRSDSSNDLARQVLNFIREAQLNYRKFFAADQLELLPRILSSLTHTQDISMPRSELAAKVAAIKLQSPIMARIGLQTDDEDLDTLSVLLSQESRYTDEPSLAVLATYVAMQETRSQTRDLIAKRLLSFEEIMDDFLVGKTVRVDSRVGLQIQAPTGTLSETDLSSGEYHFLYMMVSALLSHRSGSVIAIDEPELSLHVSWQRRVVSALARCASGASPLFLFATHSAAISAEHKDRVKVLSAEE